MKKKLVLNFDFLTWVKNLAYTKSEVTTLIGNHNTSNSSHSDIRSSIQSLEDDIGEAIDFINSDNGD